MVIGIPKLARRQWHPTPVFLPGESHGRRSLVGYSPWGRKRVGHNWATSLPLSLYHLELQDLKSMAKTLVPSAVLGSISFLPSHGTWAANVNGPFPPPQEGGSPTCESGPQAQLSFQETQSHPGAWRQCPSDLPASSRKPTTSWLRSWHRLWPWSRL